MAAGSRKKTTIAKMARERALLERRELKQAKKAARRRAAAAAPLDAPETPEPGLDADAAQRDLGPRGS